MSTQMNAVIVAATGGPEQLTFVERELPLAKPGETVLRLSRIGVNFIDVYQRRGSYPVPAGAVLGFEAIGRASDGKRYAFIDHFGAYAEYVAVPNEKLFPIPDAVGDEAAMLLFQGVTAQYLTASVHPVQPGETVLVYAAAGGVGWLLMQVVRARGGRPIGIASREEKAQLLRENGFEALVGSGEDTALIRKLVPEGVDVVFDPNGADTWQLTLESTRPRGHVVLFGAASGRIAPVEPYVLLERHSLTLSYVSIFDHIADPIERQERVDDVLSMLAAKTIVAPAVHVFPLAQASDAHAFLESRKSVGKIVLAV